MSKRDHDPYIITDHRGLYSRNDSPAPPAGFMNKATNLVFDQPSISYGDPLINTSRCRVREGFEAIGNLPAIAVRFYVYKKSTGDIIMILTTTGEFWDATNNVLILTIVDAIDFHGITLNDHFYFTPHNLVTGLNGQFVWVYDPALNPVARKAAGAIPTGIFTVAVSAVVGNIEPGTHIMAVSFKTDTGHITPPGLHVSFTAPDPKRKASLTVVPLGPIGTVGRIIWMSQSIANWDGNLKHPELFKVYEIENNTTTTAIDTIDKYDTELQFSAEPYTDLLTEIPAGTYLSNVGGRLVVCGAYLDPDVLRLSNAAEPEAIDSVDGVRKIPEGGGIKTTRPQAGNIVFWKSFMTGVLRPTDDVPSTWPYDIVDSALGSEPYGVSEALEYPGLVFGAYLVGNKAGLHMFGNGAYLDPLHPLSYNIATSWDAAASITAMKSIKIVVDPLALRIYAIVPGASQVNWFMGDFSEGLSADTIRWSPWTFDYVDQIHLDYIDAHVIVDPVISDNGTVLLAIAKNNDALRKLITNTFSTGHDIDGDIAASFGWRLVASEYRDLHLLSAKFMASSSIGNNEGVYDIKATGVEPQRFTLDISDNIIEPFLNATDRILEILITALAGDMNISDVIFFIKPVYEERGIE